MTRAWALGLLPLVLGTPGGAQTIQVTPDGPVPTLGAALALAEPGGHIVVGPGMYREPTVIVSIPVTIEGRPGAVLDGTDAGTVLLITADSVTVRGLTIRHVATSYVDDDAALKFQEVHACRVEDTTIEDAFFGIYLAKSTGCTIRRNVITGRRSNETRSGNAIHLWNSSDVIVEDNVLTGHRDGLYFEFVTEAIVRRNVSRNNLRYGLHFMFSHRCQYLDNEFIRNGAGVAVMYTKQVTMVGNRFADNWGPAAFGLLLKDITDSRMQHNVFQGNSTALHADGAVRLTVRDNQFVENGWAIKLMASSSDNEFVGNRFSGNTFDVATNSRSNTSRFRENYWDAYAGYDLDRDGYGDVPYRPVRLFALLVERYQPAMILMRSAFVGLLDLAERLLPVLTPETLVDGRPLMAWPGS